LIEHFSQIRRDAQTCLMASQRAHPQAWANFSAQVYSPTPIPSRIPRKSWPVRGLVRKRRGVESEKVSRKKAKWNESRQEEEEEPSSDEGDEVTDSEGCNIPESEYEAVTDSDGYDAIPESEYEAFTDGEEHSIPESEFEGGEDEGEQCLSGGLMMLDDDDEDEKGEVVYL
jgi:hypothetical protein